MLRSGNYADSKLGMLLAIEGGGCKKGEDTLVNALLPSKCSTLIRTTSMLSACASFCNPDLKVILLNKPYDNRLIYPENEILRKPDTGYLPEGIRISIEATGINFGFTSPPIW